LTVVPDEAQRLAAAYETVLTGGSLYRIAATWNTEGVTTTMGGEWRTSNLRNTLINPRYAGLVTYRGDIVGPGIWPAVVDRDTFDATKALLSLPDRRLARHTNARLFLLPGLALCECGVPVKTGRTQSGARTYRCSGTTPHMSRSAQPVDDYVTAVVLERLARPDAVDLLQAPAPDIAVYRERSQAIRERLDALAEALADGLLTLPAVRKASDRLRAELAKSEAELAALSRGDVLAPLVNAADPASVWDGLDLDQRRTVIDTLMSITLHSPGKGRRPFNPATVQIEWKT
jgi:hypothetical protein